MRSLVYASLFLFLSFFSSNIWAQQLRLSKLFNDHMVLQRDQPVNVWGWAEKGAEVTLTFDEIPYSTKADKAGYWKVRLAAMPAGGPHQISVSAGEEEIKLKDILMGDVWLCSGQSNMEWPVVNSNNAVEEIASANDQQIRHCIIPKHYSETAQDTLIEAAWAITSPETVGDFTAVGYFFAKALREHYDVPIGLVNNSWGGSRIEAWMSAEMLKIEHPEQAIEVMKERAKVEREKQLEQLKAIFPDLSTSERGTLNGEALWAAPELNDVQWPSITVPGTWEQQGYNGFDGIAWYRTSFILSEEEAQHNIELSLAQIDDSDITWVNGQRVGGMEQAWDKTRVYSVGADHLNTGHNTIAIRVEDTGGGGGIHGKEDLLFIKTNKQTIPLSSNWKFKIDAFKAGPSYFGPHLTPTLLYNQLIHPITDFAIKGVIWYQGESNANNAEDAIAYQEQFKTMIDGWRQQWNIGDFPFLYVQLANYMAVQPEPGESNWALLRESQTMTLQTTSNIAQAVTIDVGEADDIHPRNKQEVGWRLSLAARKLAYGEDLEYSGPVYKNHEVKEGKFILTFDHIGEGLENRNKYGDVHGFAIAGADKKFVWGKARLDGNQLIVWSEKVSKPLYLRYGWADNPANVSLYNSAGLPMGPFRIEKTDGKKKVR